MDFDTITNNELEVILNIVRNMFEYSNVSSREY